MKKTYRKPTRKTTTRKKTYGAKKTVNMKTVKSMVKRLTLKTQETKRSVNVNAAKSTVVQQTLLLLDGQPLRTSQGVTDPNSSGAMQNRIGDEVTPVGLRIKFMVALDPRQSQVKFRWMFVKGPFADIPNIDNLFVGMCSNKQLDEIDRERWTVMASKTFTIRRGNAAVSAPAYTTTLVQQGGQDTGMEYDGKQNQQWIPKLCTAWIPGRKFGSVLKYQNAAQVPKMYSYHSFIIAYGCDQATDPTFLVSGTSLARMDDYISTFYFKDS